MVRRCALSISIATLLATAISANPISHLLRGDNSSSSTKRDASPGFTWGSTPLRGVNIGGWLVLEPWITPSIFESVPQELDIVDEYTLCQNFPSQARSILQSHWASWTSAADFQKIASAGINVVRIPIGYWAFDNSYSPYVQGAAEYLEQALHWARATTPPLQAIIDLHGAPGSQNGFDNSGQRLDSSQITFLNGGVGGQTAEQGINVLTQIAERWGGADWEDVVLGIELLNEPIGWQLNNTDLRAWLATGYDRVRAFGDTTVVIQDAFLELSSWNGFLMPWTSGAQRVVMGEYLSVQQAPLTRTDHHYYQVFDNGLIQMSQEQHIAEVCNAYGSYAGSDKWSFVGEWSGAMTDCAQYLNGYGRGARYDGTFNGSPYVGSCSGVNDLCQWTDSMKANTKAYIEKQVAAFEQASEGWTFWNFKTERSPEWDFFQLLDAGIFPNPVSSVPQGSRC